MRRGVVVRSRGLARAVHGTKPVLLRTSAAAPRREHSAAAAAHRDLKALTVPQLKEIVRSDNVSLNGGLRHKRKSELIDAILEHRTKEGTLRAPRGTPSLYTGSGELAPRPALGEPFVAEIPATVQKKVRTGMPDVVAALSTLKRGDRPQVATEAAAAPREGPRVPQLVQPTAAVLEAPGMVSDALAEAPVVIFSKTFCPYCKDVLAMFDKLGLTQAPHIVELDLLQPQRMDAVQDHLKDLTGARSVPRVFVDGKFIGGADDTIAAYASGKLAEVLVEAGALPMPVPKPAPAPSGTKAPTHAPPPAPPPAPQPTSALLEELAALPTRANRAILVAPSSRTAPRGARPAPTMHQGAGELAPVQDTAIIAAPNGPRYSPVSTRSKLDVVQHLKETTSARTRVSVAPKTPAEVEVAKMERSVKAAPKATPKAEPKAEPPSTTPPAKTAPKTSSSVGGGGSGAGSSAGSALGGFTLPGGLSLDKLSVPQMAGAAVAAWALGLVTIYLNKPKTDDIPPSAPNTQQSISQAIKDVSAAELGAAGKEELAAVVRIVQRLDRIENEIANVGRPNPRRDALLKAKKLQGDAAGAGNARDPDRMKRLQATAADLREACAAQGAGTEAIISAKVAEVDTAEKIEAAAVGVTLGVASGLLVYGLVGAFGLR